MKKLFKLLLFLSFLYAIFQLVFNFFSKGYTINYEINNDKKFLIKEIKTQRIKNEKDNYYFEISVDDMIFSFQTFKSLNHMQKVISDIKYYSDEYYTCIYPIIGKGQMISDVLCNQGGIYYSYNTIKGSDINLDNFVQNIEEYQENSYIENEDVIKSDSYIILYKNINKNIYLGVENYKGIYTVNSHGFKDNSLFKKDIYNKEISGYLKKYYVVADYNQDYEFHEFYVINLENNNISKIISNNSISMYSYVNGIVDNSLYIFDTSNKKQYEINIKTKTAIEVGNEASGIKKYENGIWSNVSVYEALNNRLIFNNTQITEFEGKMYDKVELVGGEKSGYYYLYQKSGNFYKVYRVNVQNKGLKQFLFNTTSVNDIYYNNEEVYYKDGSYIKFYSDLTGSKKILKYDEVSFNNNLKYSIYKR